MKSELISLSLLFSDREKSICSDRALNTQNTKTLFLLLDLQFIFFLKYRYNSGNNSQCQNTYLVTSLIVTGFVFSPLRTPTDACNASPTFNTTIPLNVSTAKESIYHLVCLDGPEAGTTCPSNLYCVYESQISCISNTAIDILTVEQVTFSGEDVTWTIHQPFSCLSNCASSNATS